MRKIKIFIGSSIDELSDERKSLVSFISHLNNKYVDKGIYIEPYICEETSSRMTSNGSQTTHDQYIEREADATIFMFFKKAGQYTLHELELAYNCLIDNSKPDIFIYFKTSDSLVETNTEIEKAIDIVANNYGHYYKKFSDADTIKLELLQYIISILNDGTAITIKDGKFYIENHEIPEIELSADNVFAFQNNPHLRELANDIERLKKQVVSASVANDWDVLYTATTELNEKRNKYSNLQTNILNMLTSFYKEINHKDADKILIEAFRLFELGKVDEAKKLLPSKEIICNKATNILKQKKLINDMLSQQAKDVIHDAWIRINVLYLDSNNEERFTEIDELYSGTIELAIGFSNHFDVSYFVYNYSMFLSKLGDFKKAIEYKKQALKLLENRKDFKNSSAYFLCYNSLAMDYECLKEISLAEETYNQLISLYDNADCSETDCMSMLGVLYNNLGYMYSNNLDYDMTYFERAENALKRAIEIRKELKEKDSDTLSDLLCSYNNLGSLYLNNQQKKKFVEQIAYYIIDESEHLEDVQKNQSLSHAYELLIAFYSDEASKEKEVKKIYEKLLTTLCFLYEHNSVDNLKEYAKVLMYSAMIDNQADSALAINKCQKAINISIPFLKFREDEELMYIVVLCSSLLADCFFKNKNFNEMKKFSTLAIDYIERIERLFFEFYSKHNELAGTKMHILMKLQLIDLLSDIL